jgi:hypothetical protein
MRMRSLLAVALLAVSAGLPAWCVQNDPDQTKAVEGSNARPPATKQQALPPGRMNPRNLKAPKLPPPDPVKQLREFQALSPAEREKELAKLPPPRRERVERQLANFDAMTPEQRRGAVQDEIKRLRELRPRDRRDYLYSDEFKRKYSPEEQELIHGAFPKL